MDLRRLHRSVVSTAHALAEFLDAANDSCTALYSSHGMVHGSSSKDELRSSLLGLVQSSRLWSHNLAALNVTDEMRALVGDAPVSVNVGTLPDRADVEQYISDAIDYAVERSNRQGAFNLAAFVKAAFRAHTIVESETLRAYEAAKLSAYESLRGLGSSDRSIGEQCRDDATIVLCVRWCAINDRNTCERCLASDGEISPIFPLLFTQGPPPAHARCRCFTHLWAVGVAWEDEPEAGEELDEPEEDEPRSTGRVAVRRGRRRGFTTMADEAVSQDRPNLFRTYTPQEARTIELDESERSFEVVASTEAWDSYDTRILSSAWDLARYRANPVFLAAHNTRSLHAIIGRAEVRIEGGKLLAKVTLLPPGANEESDLAWNLYKAGVLKGISVGFDPSGYHEEKLPADHPRSGDRGIVFTRVELVEISAVPIPANPEALARAFDALRKNAAPLQPDMGATVAEPSATEMPIFSRALAELLGVETEEQAVQEIAKRDLAIDGMKLERDKFEQRAVAAEAELKRIADAEAEDAANVVDALIKNGRLSESKRASALALARSSPKAFRDIYPPVPEAPKAHILKSLVNPEPINSRKTAETMPDPVSVRAEELMKTGIKWHDAWIQAAREFESKK